MLHCQIFGTEHTAGVVCSKNIYHRRAWHRVSQSLLIFFFFKLLRHFLCSENKPMFRELNG